MAGPPHEHIRKSAGTDADPYAEGMTDVPFRKGHGTGNDFVLIPDPDDAIALTPAIVRAVCHRRFGIGADGVLRMVPAPTGWFMDYWNSDGTLSEMCGNGARVFARHLVEAGLEAPGSFDITTRGGVRRATVPDSGDVSIAMGPVTGAAELADTVTVSLGEHTWPAVAAHAPNPHAVATLPQLAALGDIATATAAPKAVFPQGANIEFVEVVGEDHLRMRVWERGSGETLSCGTGACAVAWAYLTAAGPVTRERTVTVEVPGGTVWVSINPDHEAVLTGPAVFVAEGTIPADWWAAHR